MTRRLGVLTVVLVVALAAEGVGQPVAESPPMLKLPREEAPQRKEEQKYPDTAGIDLVTDAPWRVVRRGPDSVLPLLLFVPDANLPDRGFVWDRNRFRGLGLRRISVYEGGRTLYEDTANAEPTAGRDLEVVDEIGRRVSNDLAGGENRCAGTPACDVPRPGGWHRILRIPVARLSGRTTIFLKTEIVAEAVYDRDVKIAPFVYSRTLRVQVADEPFPSLGESWRYFDAHMHTIAEWSLSRELLAPRKAFGGPVQMIHESAWAMGLLIMPLAGSAPGANLGIPDLKHRVIVTDHNAFFSDCWALPVGPTAVHPALDPNCDRKQIGRLEFDRMREVFGVTFGEEVTLRTPFTDDSANFGSHLLLMRADHRDGPWHGGLLTFAIFDVNLGKPFGGEKNDNTLEDVLRDAARLPGAFAYAAHPFARGNHWNQRGAARYLELFHSDSPTYVTPDRKFVLKGAQYWNEKAAFELRAEREDRIRNVDFFDLHPFEDAPATPTPRESYFKVQLSYPRFSPNPAWDEELQTGLIDWHTRIRKLLRFSMSDTPEIVFPRKLYVIAGSDAHGDFNYSTTLLATVLDNAWLRSCQCNASRRMVTSNAFGLVRTYVDTSDKPGQSPEERALNALADGNAIVTDGPVLTFAFDADARFDSARREWRDDAQLVSSPAGRLGAEEGFNEDGRIGGDGAYDGGFTALVVKGTRHAALRYRWNASSEFGPPFGGAPRAINLYVDRPGQPVETIDEARGPASRRQTVKVLRPLRQLATPERGQQNRDQLLLLDGGELAMDTVLALSMAAFSRKNEREEFRAYTNPIWVVPVDVTVASRTSTGTVPAGDLTVTFTFGMSMTPNSYRVVVQALDAQGRNRGPATELAPDTNAGPGGWGADPAGARNTIYRVRSTAPLDPTSAAGGRFVLYLVEPRDAHGNALNSFATTATLPR